MRKFFSDVILLSLIITMFSFIPSIQVDAAGEVPVFEIYNARTNESLFTKDTNEVKVQMIKNGWTCRGIAFYAAQTGTPVYRIFNRNTGEHHYTKDQNEVNYNTSHGAWNNEAVAFYVSESSNYPVYRVFNKNSTRKTGSHWYTINEQSMNNFVNAGWNYEMIAWYSSKPVAQGSYDYYNGLIPDFVMKEMQQQDPESTGNRIENEIFELTNQERIRAGVNPVERSAILDQAAAIRAKEIADMRKLNNHIRPDGRAGIDTLKDDFGIDVWFGENLGYASWTMTGAEAVNLWMNSTGHRNNMLAANRTHIGVAVEVVNGAVYMVQAFTFENPNR